MTFHIGKVFLEELTQVAVLLTVIHEVIITKVNRVHRALVVHLRFCDVDERKNVCIDFIERMHRGRTAICQAMSPDGQGDARAESKTKEIKLLKKSHLLKTSVPQNGTKIFG